MNPIWLNAVMASSMAMGWWTAGGATGAVAVYQPKGAASLAASYADLSGNAYNLAPVVTSPSLVVGGWSYTANEALSAGDVLGSLFSAVGAKFSFVVRIAPGTNTNTVRWEFQISRALGHNQANFGAPTSYYVTQAGAGTAWRHMVAEVDDADALILVEPDEIILVTLRRVTNGGTNNTDTIFALTVDFHYEADREVTPNKAPNFYV
jgi:hypothetical protein